MTIFLTMYNPIQLPRLARQTLAELLFVVSCGAEPKFSLLILAPTCSLHFSMLLGYRTFGYDLRAWKLPCDNVPDIKTYCQDLFDSHNLS